MKAIDEDPNKAGESISQGITQTLDTLGIHMFYSRNIYSRATRKPKAAAAKDSKLLHGDNKDL